MASQAGVGNDFMRGIFPWMFPAQSSPTSAVAAPGTPMSPTAAPFTGDHRYGSTTPGSQGLDQSAGWPKPDLPAGWDDTSTTPAAAPAAVEAAPETPPWILPGYSWNPNTNNLSYVGDYDGVQAELDPWVYGEYQNYMQGSVANGGFTDPRSMEDFPTWVSNNIDSLYPGLSEPSAEESVASALEGLNLGTDPELMKRFDDLEERLNDKNDSSDMMALMAALMGNQGNNESFGGGGQTSGAYYPSGQGLF